MQPKNRPIKRGEALAILPEAVHSSPGAFFLMLAQPIPENERCGSVAVVHVRGALDHFEGSGLDSYEAICKRTQAAFCAEEKPSHVVLKIDSPGGVVSGLNQTVFRLRAMSEEYGIPLVAYVDELAASAAYAICCACDDVYAPPSAVVGSIGVISTLFDQVGADEKLGLNFVTITSGARKADSNPHVSLSETAVTAEQKRVDELARQFFELVSPARKLSTKKVAAFEAGIFLGEEGYSANLIDGVMGWDELLSILDVEKTVDATRQNTTTSQSLDVLRQKEPQMLNALQALVKKTQAALDAETDPKKIRAMATTLSSYEAALDAYRKEKHTVVEKHVIEEGEDPKEEAKTEAPAKDDDDEEDPEEKKATISTNALASLAEQVTGKKGEAVVGALAALLAQGQRASKRLDTIEQERASERKEASISAALSGNRITPHEAKDLRGKSGSFVESFLSMRTKAIVNTDGDIVIPGPNSPGSQAQGLPQDVLAAIDMAVNATPDGIDRVAMRKSMVDAHEKRIAAAVNGAGRY